MRNFLVLFLLGNVAFAQGVTNPNFNPRYNLFSTNQLTNVNVTAAMKKLPGFTVNIDSWHKDNDLSYSLDHNVKASYILKGFYVSADAIKDQKTLFNENNNVAFGYKSQWKSSFLNVSFKQQDFKQTNFSSKPNQTISIEGKLVF
jgi:hypothetical protein